MTERFLGNFERPPGEEKLLGLGEHLASLGAEQDGPHLQVVEPGWLSTATGRS